MTSEASRVPPKGESSFAVRSTSAMRTRKVILFVVNVDWYFLSHRAHLVAQARARGWDVHVAAADSGSMDAIADLGATCHPIPMTRAGTNPILEVITLASVLRTMWHVRADVTHLIGVKAIFHGSVASLAFRRAHIVCAFSGFGYALETLDTVRARLFSRSMGVLLRRKNVRLVVQNEGHARDVVDRGWTTTERVTIVEGAGIDLQRYACGDAQTSSLVEDSSQPPVVVSVGRMLWDKGIAEFVETARRVKARTGEVRFVLVGPSGDDNPASIPASRIRAWVDEGVVEWWGQRDDVADVLADASIYLAASHHEGLPKAGLEALASGLPLIVTDIAGHRALVANGNGVLVPPRDVEAMASAVVAMLDDPMTRSTMGRASRIHAERRFSMETVARAHFDLYDQILDERFVRQ